MTEAGDSERQVEAGFADRALGGVADERLPDVDSAADIADPGHPCNGAVPTTHSHVFTEDGKLASLDAHGEQVDEATDRVVDDDTFVIPYVFAARGAAYASGCEISTRSSSSIPA